MLVLHDLPDFIAPLNEPDQVALLGAPFLHRCINEATRATWRREQRRLTQQIPPVPADTPRPTASGCNARISLSRTNNGREPRVNPGRFPWICVRVRRPSIAFVGRVGVIVCVTPTCNASTSRVSLWRELGFDSTASWSGFDQDFPTFAGKS